MRAYAEIFKALSDETRLTILALLLRYGELCVCDVEAVLEISQSKASRHLRYLKNAGLLKDRRQGIWVYYRVTEKPSAKVESVLKSNREMVSSLVGGKIEKRFDDWMEKKKTTGDICKNTSTKEGVEV